MASITKRIKANGDIVYDAAIKIRKHGVIVHREKKSFAKQKLAKDWGMRREVELQTQDVYKTREYLPIKKVIEQYIKEFDPRGRSKLFDLQKLIKRDIALIDVNNLAAKDLVKHIRLRNKECLPQTAANDLIWLKTVIKAMKAVIDINLDLTIFDSAREVLKNEGLIANSTQRERIATPRELLMLTRYLDEPTKNCMWFALYSARRQSEITRLEWADLNEKHKTILVRDLKHPRIKNLCKTAKLPASAFKIIMKQKRTSKYIFPYNSKTIGTYFHNACKMLGINDLHFHDLRHSATTFYAGKGLNILELRLITLHRSLSSLQRYVNLKAEDLKI